MDLSRCYDPELAAAAAELPSGGADRLGDLPASRAALAAMFGTAQRDPPGESGVIRDVRNIPGPGGAPDLQVRIHRPAGAMGSLPCLLWLHGSGYVLGSAAWDDPLMRHLAVACDCATCLTTIDPTGR